MAAAILAAALSLFLLRGLLQQDGAVVAVYVDGEKTAEYSLDRNDEIRLPSADGGYNVLVIQDGAADVTEADCPDKTCVNSRAIRHTGESITCLPHRTQFIIEGAGEPEVDLMG